MMDEDFDDCDEIDELMKQEKLDTKKLNGLGATTLDKNKKPTYWACISCGGNWSTKTEEKPAECPRCNHQRNVLITEKNKELFEVLFSQANGDLENFQRSERDFSELLKEYGNVKKQTRR